MSRGPVTPAAPQPTGVPEDAAVARVVTRFSTAYVLRAFQLLIDSYGDMRVALLILAINAANTAHVGAQDDAKRRAVGALDAAAGAVPDELRRPISIARLADSVGMPFESVRRLVRRLVDAGACVRARGGVIVPRASAERPEVLHALIANVGYVRRFMRDLHGAGLIEAFPACLATPGEAAEDIPIARSVARVSREYLLRAIVLLTETYGDLRAGIVAQTIVAANTSHLDAQTGEGGRYAGIAATPPDEVRRPVSIARLAESLGLPYETIRRQVERLIDANICVRVPGGVIVPRTLLERPDSVSAMLANVGYVRKLARDLGALR